MTDAEFRPIQRGAKALGLVFLVVASMALATNVSNAFGADFMSFWAASVLAVGGDPAAAYDVQAHQAVQARIASLEGLLPFFYPPPFLILLLPLGLLPYWAAALLWTLTTGAAYLIVARRLLPGSGWLVLAFPAVIVNVIVGQNGFVTAALFIAGLLWLPKRPFMAGLILGCLVIKPQLGVLLPLAFIAARQPQAFAGAAVSSLGLLLASWLLFGSQAYQAFAGQADLYGRILADGSVGWHKMASVYASLRLLGAPLALAATLQIAVALAAGLLVWLVCRRPVDWFTKGAVLAPATLLISPYLYLYDTMILIVPFLWLLGVERRRWMLVLLWCVLLIGVGQNWGFNQLINPIPFVTIALLLLVFRHALAGASSQDPNAPAVPPPEPRATLKAAGA